MMKKEEHPDTSTQTELYDDDKRRTHPRGYYFQKDAWSEDETEHYYEGFS